MMDDITGSTMDCLNHRNRSKFSRSSYELQYSHFNLIGNTLVERSDNAYIISHTPKLEFIQNVHKV
jgi:hypothetical protein